jgi:ketosteroid isomerase-like protein
MKGVKLWAVVISTLIVLSAGSLPAQEWSAEQQAVWAVVEGYWAAGAAEDLAAMMAAMDDDYLGWSNSDPIPGDKSSSEKWFKYGFEYYDWILYELKPVGISVFDDFAIVHYYYTGVYKDVDGERISTEGRWTDILRKVGDKWLLIGDHGGRTDDD